MVQENSNEKTEQSSVDFFDWYATTTRYAFPTDYALTDLKDKWGADRRTIAKYITQSELFSVIFQHMRYDGDSSTPPKKHSEYNGIPAELELFFKLYLDEVLIENQASSIARGSITKDFDEKLCATLYEKAMEAERSDNSERTKDLYMFRRLYGNKAFGNYVTKHFWTEFRSRCNALEEIALQQSPEEQMDALKQVLGFMDILIADLLWKNKTSKFSGQGSDIQVQCVDSSDSLFVKSFPLELVNRLRNRQFPSKVVCDELAIYRIPNLTIHDDNSQKDQQLKNAFEEIVSSANGWSKTLRQARECYMQYIREQKNVEPLQKQCETLQQYLNDFKSPPDDEELRADIEKICIQHFRAILVGTPGYVNHEANRNVGERYRFINDVITRLCNDFVFKYQWAVSYMYSSGLDYDALRVSMDLLVSNVNAYIEDTKNDSLGDKYLQDVKQQYLDGIEQLWDEQLLGRFSDIKENIINGHLEKIAIKIEDVCICAIESFGLQIPQWATKKAIVCNMGRYRELVSHDVPAFPEVTRTLHDIYLIRALFTCRIWGEYNRTKEKVYDYYKLLSAYIHNHR